MAEGGCRKDIRGGGEGAGRGCGGGVLGHAQRTFFLLLLPEGEEGKESDPEL